MELRVGLKVWWRYKRGQHGWDDVWKQVEIAKVARKAVFIKVFDERNRYFYWRWTPKNMISDRPGGVAGYLTHKGKNSE